ncbi:MAG: nucleotidyltransferase domain-containing protein [Candidatus Methanoperedens sp.]|nr:nucleotidyltransferase domain-containing protein [Candidatus Methanoperedens sp.]
MVKDKIAEAIKFFENCLKEKGLKVSKIILFGSQSTGKGTLESDVDILIISPDFQNKDIFERARLTKEAEIKTTKKFRVPLDIITLTFEEFESGKSLVAGICTKRKSNVCGMTSAASSPGLTSSCPSARSLKPDLRVRRRTARD